MPIQVSESKLVEYRYDPDYLQGEENRHLKTYPDIVCDKLGLKTIKTDVILDGGNVIKWDNCVILTDKILIENEKGYKPNELIDNLKQLFEVEKTVLIPWDEDNDFYGHADGMIRFIDRDKVLLHKYFDDYPEEYKERLFGALSDNGISWEKLGFEVKNEDERNWAYINFLQTKDIILLPKLNTDEDKQALDFFKSIFIDYAEREMIKQVDVRELVEEGGALNCVSWNIQE